MNEEEAPSVPEAQPALDPEQARATGEVLRGEYMVLLTALTATWGVSMTRTSLLLGVLSAAGVALGFVAQGTGFGTEFFVFAVVLLPVTLVLGLATFARQVQISRETAIYVVGMNRIRHFLLTAVPGAEPYLVLSTHDDEFGIYRSPGSGMLTRPPRWRLGYSLVQATGVVAVVDAVIAAAVVAIAGAWLALPLPVVLGAAGVVGLGTLAALLLAWKRSVDELQAHIRPINPTPPGGLSEPW